jgi:anti-sigma regulatory factor (Ser/Thr protein kinase)
MGDAFRHEALLYAGEDEFLAGTGPFVRAAVQADEPVLVAVSERKIALLEGELGDAADGVLFTEMAQLGCNPARIIPAWRDFVREHGGRGERVWGIGEPVWPGRSECELEECDHHESLLNVTFADTPEFTLLCPYDTAALTDEAVDAARRNHPVLRQGQLDWDSEAYLDPASRPGPFHGELSPPPAGARQFFFTADYLTDLRDIVFHRAEDAGLTTDRALDLVLAINELASNSAVHSGGAGVVRLWSEGATLVCEVADEGLIEDPLAGRRRPEPSDAYGRGLFLVNQVCDLVQIRSGPGGTVVRVRMALDPAAQILAR